MSASTTRDKTEEAFKGWADSGENLNHARLGDDKYAEYVLMLTCPDTKPPQHIVDKQERQKWSNSRAHAIKHYELVDGKLWRKADKTYPKR